DGIRDFHVTGVQTCALPIYKVSAFLRSQIAGRQGGIPAGGKRATATPGAATDGCGFAAPPAMRYQCQEEMEAGDHHAEIAGTGQIGRASCRERMEEQGGVDR